VKVDEASTLHFGDLQVVNLGNQLQVPLAKSTFLGQRSTNCLHGVVPEL
jgi:hypothetical protein